MNLQIQKQIEELEKGCGRWFEVKGTKGRWKCGEVLFDTIGICEICQSKLQAIRQTSIIYEKAEADKVKKLKDYVRESNVKTDLEFSGVYANVIIKIDEIFKEKQEDSEE